MARSAIAVCLLAFAARVLLADEVADAQVIEETVFDTFVDNMVGNLFEPPVKSDDADLDITTLGMRAKTLGMPRQVPMSRSHLAISSARSSPSPFWHSSSFANCRLGPIPFTGDAHDTFHQPGQFLLRAEADVLEKPADAKGEAKGEAKSKGKGKGKGKGGGGKGKGKGNELREPGGTVSYQTANWGSSKFFDDAWSSLKALKLRGHALIMQNKGGGHAEIGYHLAKRLSTLGMKVTMLQDKAASKDTAPFNQYVNLTDDANVHWVDPTNGASYKEAAMSAIKDLPGVTHIFDIYSKEPNDISTLVSLAEASSDFKLYTYVSSAGMYNDKGELFEDSIIKEPPTGQRLVELKLNETLPGKWTSFRPQYIYGPYTNKRYLDWFIERAVNDLPMPVPGDASQPANLAHCEDIASLMSSVIGKEEEAADEIFNCGSSYTVTYKAVCEAAAKAVQKTPEIVSVDPGTKTSFPFRTNPEGFFINVDKAKNVLKWEGSEANVLRDIRKNGFYFQDFMAKGLDKKEVDTSNDMPAGAAAAKKEETAPAEEPAPTE